MKKQDRINAINAITIAYGDRLNTLSAKDLAALHKMLKDRAKILGQETIDTTNTNKEEPTMTATNPIPVTISSAEFIDAMTAMAAMYNWTLSTPKKEDGVIAREGRKRVLELYWSHTKEALGGFDLYMRDDLFQDITDLIKKNGIIANLTVNLKWNMTHRYSFDRQNTKMFLSILKSI